MQLLLTAVKQVLGLGGVRRIFGMGK